MNSIEEKAAKKVESIFQFKSKDKVQKILKSFGYSKKEELANEFTEILKAYKENKKGANYNYFCMYLTSEQMDTFTIFERELRGLMGCSEEIPKLGKYNI